MFPPVDDITNSNSVARRCEWGFVETLRECRPELMLNRSGRVGNPTDNLLHGIPFKEFIASFKKGAGNELGSVRNGVSMPGKFCSAYSSSALAVNHFAPFKSTRTLPILGKHRRLRLVDFEVDFPTGLSGTAPHLDALFVSEIERVAIESKCLEYLRIKTPKALEKTSKRLKDKYLNGVKDARRQSAWFAELRELAAEPTRYRQLDAAQLLKHALGLLNSPTDVPTSLVYLFWEPLDAALSPVFASHREEIGKFGSRVRDAGVQFEALSYPELWEQWRDSGDPFLIQHVIALRRRYAIPAFAWEGVSFMEEGWSNSGLIDD